MTLECPTQLSDFFSGNSAPLQAALQDPRINWEHLVKQASVERLLPALHHQVASAVQTSALPAEILHLFSSSESLNAERNRIILAEAVHVAVLLNQIGILPVALKGLAYLLTGVYSNPAQRYLLDIDILLSEQDFPRAIAHLHNNGYFENDSADFPLLKQHHPAIRRAGLPHIEIHHQVGLGVCGSLLPASTILASAKPFTVDGGRFLIPSPTDLVNHLILHSQLHHSYHDRIFPPLRALVDLRQIQKRFGAQIDWPSLLKTYRDKRELGTLLMHLHQAHDILGLPLPPGIPARLPFSLRLRYARRQFLQAHPTLRYCAPDYLLMSLLSRRLRLVPLILSNPSSWVHAIRLLTRRSFYRKLVSG